MKVQWSCQGVLRSTALVVVTMVVLTVVPVEARAASDGSVAWTSFSESSGCEEPYTATPVASKRGTLSDSELVLGPFGRYFGWSIGDIRDDLVWWTVPGGGQTRVHRLALPAFEQVAAGLEAAAAEGRTYEITSAVGFVNRTIGANHRMSRHALGLAIDINPGSNPYREDGTLVTDMPDWFVQIWRDAGFCWGGDWLDQKDAMHFSWMGPQTGTRSDALLAPLPAPGSAIAYGSRVSSAATVFDDATSVGRSLLVADGNGNGAPDVIAIRGHESGAVLEVASGTTGWQECSVGRWLVSGLAVDEVDEWVFADIDGDSRQDLIGVDLSAGAIRLDVATRAGDFGDLASVSTVISSSAVEAVTGADYDGDRRGDLWIFRDSGVFEVWRGPDFTSVIHSSTLPSTSGRVGVADRDGDLFPEIFVLDDSGTLSVFHKQGIAWSLLETAGLGPSAAGGLGFGVIDHDGDSRPDVNVLGSDGELDVFFGNTALGGTAARWFFNPSTDCDGENRLLWDGSFFDDDDSIFESNIESIAADGITRGCNPPFRDRFCPDDVVTRGQMAAFLVRALGLPAGPPGRFTDDDDSIFERDIEALAAAGITRGCAPDRFCPDDVVTRGQMAAFLHRALGGMLAEGAPLDFVDTATSEFEADIAWLSAVGITKGCAADRFCPNDGVTRGQMAAFLDRALP